MRRTSSGLSLVVGVDKPSGITSHDVVNACRHIFGERRIGHAGTLDPLATGVLLVCVGSATRLATFFSANNKRYHARIAFGVSTDTDDAQGAIRTVGDVSSQFYDVAFAEQAIAGLCGCIDQIPPAYSALKVGGKKACNEARAGRSINFEPREVEVFEARLQRIVTREELQTEGEILVGVAAECTVFWDLEFYVSKGTYIRSLARDLGYALGCPAHLAALRRTASGQLSYTDCVSLEVLRDLREHAALDPVKLLGMRCAYATDHVAALVANGRYLSQNELELHFPQYAHAQSVCDAYVLSVSACENEPIDGELVAILDSHRLRALYTYRESARRFEARCVFVEGVSRGDL